MVLDVSMFRMRECRGGPGELVRYHIHRIGRCREGLPEQGLLREMIT